MGNGRIRAIHAACDVLASEQDGVLVGPVERAIDAALASGGVVEIDRAAEVVDHDCAETHQQIAGWATESAREAEARVRELEGLLDEVLGHITQEGHPGRPCVSTGWIPVEMVREWRARARRD